MLPRPGPPTIRKRFTRRDAGAFFEKSDPEGTTHEEGAVPPPHSKEEPSFVAFLNNFDRADAGRDTTFVRTLSIADLMKSKCTGQNTKQHPHIQAVLTATAHKIN